MNIENINSLKAYEILTNRTDSILVDVRTDKEWKEVGIPKLNNEGLVIFLSWRLLPNMSLNENFGTEFMNRVADKNIHVLFLCRSGSRSLEAASYAASIGYKNCYNIIDGFDSYRRHAELVSASQGA